jgi:hypothetical protein
MWFSLWLARRQPIACGTLVTALLLLSSDARSTSQLPQPPLPVDPTPIYDLLTQAEKTAVDGSRDPKRKVEEYLKIADVHLDLAYSAIDRGDFRGSERELDIYNKAATEAVKIAFSLKDGKRGLAKKIEQRLYKHLKTLEMVENRFPAERIGFATAAIEKAKRLRVRALNEAFGGANVLKNPATDSDSQSLDKRERPELYEAGFAFAIGWRMRDPRARQLPGDYLTEEEDDHVRQAQQIDERIKVFMKIADRRLAALSTDVTQPADKKLQKKIEEELREWGAVPKVSRAELLQHYARAIDECIAKLEDAHERNPKSSAIPKALTVLRDATGRHLQLLQSLSSEMTSDRESLALAKAIDEAKFANNGAKEGLK